MTGIARLHQRLRACGLLRSSAGPRACAPVLLLHAALGCGLGANASAAAPEASSTPAAPASAAASGPLPRLLRVEPPRDSAHHIGDQVVYRALLAWPPGWDLERDGLRAPTRENPPVELLGHRLARAAAECSDCRWLSVDWQVFKAVQLTSDLVLPAATLRLRKGAQTVELRLPASPLAVSPLVPWERRANWVQSMRPGWQVALFDVRARLIEAGAWLTAALLALAGWAWSSGRWLPRRAGRPFAQAWRSSRARRLRAPQGQSAQADAQDLRCWHRAFDASAGQALFAQDLDAFFAAHPEFAPLADPVRALFAASQRAFFLAPDSGASGVARQDLIALLQRLAEHEFRAARAPRQQAPGRSGRAPPPALAPGGQDSAHAQL